MPGPGTTIPHLTILQHSGNDMKQAQRRHQMRLQFGWTSGPRSSRPTPASHIEGTPAGLKGGRQTPRTMQDNDDYDIITPQSDQEVFHERGHDSTSSPQRPSRASSFLGGPPYGSRDHIVNPSRPSAHDGTTTVNEKANAIPEQRASFPRRSTVTPRTSDLSQPLHRPASDDRILSSASGDKPGRNKDCSRDEVEDEDTTSEHKPAKEHDTVPSAIRAEWDFILPTLPSTGITSPMKKTIPRFSIRTLVETIQVQADAQAVENYLGREEPHTVRSQINTEIDGFPSIFYVVAANNDRILRSWIAHGADVNAVHGDSGVPLLAFAIVLGEILEEDTTDIVATLLSTGSSPAVIPQSLYDPYDRDLVNEEVEKEGIPETVKTPNQSEQTAWIYPMAKQRLIRNLNLTHRYNLERASRIQKPSLRQRQVAERYNAQGLLGLPYFLIGQSLATSKLLQTCINHLVNRTERRKPLVLVFAGPSGHGKTELARRLGYLMSLDLEVVDCTIVNREIELFGGRHPYVNAEEGTPINNFLAKNSGRRCIVFLDEFEKTTRDIHQALLLPFDNGEYQDRRNLQMVDCSRTIWILATNALDRRIRDFCKVHEAVLFDDQQVESRTQLMKQLDKDLKNDLLGQFDVSKDAINVEWEISSALFVERTRSKTDVDSNDT